MSVEGLLREDAQHLAHEAARHDHEALFARIRATLNSAEADQGDDSRTAADTHWTPEAEHCAPPGDDDVPPLDEIRFHMAHALRSASCARRTAELFELLGHDHLAATCWRFAAAAGDADAQDYVAEFIAPSLPAPSPVESREQFADLVQTYG